MEPTSALDIISRSVNSILAMCNIIIDCNPEDRAAAYKILKCFSQLSPSTRQAIVPSMRDIARMISRIIPFAHSLFSNRR